MDGNRRWARAKGLPAVQGHQHVVDNVLEPLVDKAIALGIEFVTLWAFSTENWERDKEELSAIMNLFRYGLQKKADMLMKKGVRIRVLGDLEKFPKDIADTCRRWIEETKDNTTITVVFALNYGGRDEIVRAINRSRASADTAQMDEKRFSTYLDNPDIPDPDLIIRPGGQLRLSGFMPWQATYAELYFSPILMPDFSPDEFEKAIADYHARQRRFGR